jgi:hypothetical protein
MTLTGPLLPLLLLKLQSLVLTNFNLTLTNTTLALTVDSDTKLSGLSIVVNPVKNGLMCGVVNPARIRIVFVYVRIMAPLTLSRGSSASTRPSQEETLLS